MAGTILWHNSIFFSRIDRVLVSGHIGTLWPFQMISTIDSTLSDHFPIVFKSDVSLNRGPKPFRPLNIWWDDNRFLPFLEKSWVSISSDANVTKLLR